jgi:hypothetical protein
MTCRRLAVIVVAAAAMVAMSGWLTAAQVRANLAGRWTFKPGLSRIPEDLGFGMDMVAGAGPDADERAGAWGAGLPAMQTFRESADDATRRTQLVEEVQSPPLHVSITEAADAVTIDNERTQPRVFHTDGRAAFQAIGQVPVGSTARWDGARFEVRYRVQQGRELLYTYARTDDPPRLVVAVRFIEKNGHDSATIVYEPAKPGEPREPERKPAVPSAGRPFGGLPARFGDTGGLPPGADRPTAPPSQAPAGLPPGLQAPARPQAPVLQGPDATLRGLTSVGLVVEEFRPQAAACGLTRAPVESAVLKALTDAGFKVLRDADEDTYVYVDVITTSTSAGLCISRYDVSLFANATATLSHQTATSLVQAVLLHDGGIAGGTAAVHAESVLRNVRQVAEGFATRIKAANK